MPLRGDRRARTTKATQAWAARASRWHPSATELEKIDIGERMCTQFNWESARPFQIEGTRAQLLGKNAIIHASTGKGKTAIAAGPHTIAGMCGRVTLFVAPLLALHTEMTKTFKSKFGLSAVAVNSLIEGGTKDLFWDIIQGKYQVVILAPEMLLHRRFVDAVLKSRQFRERILSIVIDEAHCISHWGDSFRKLYGLLGNVRAFLLPHTSIIAMSGTFTRRVRRDVCKKLGFSSTGDNYIFIDEGNARTNVSLASIAMKHPMNSYRDLDFVIPPGVSDAHDLVKTMIYADDKDTIYEIIDHIRGRIPPSINAEVVRPFTASHTPEYREEVMDAFIAGKIYILVCTEAAGMGCDIPDIDLVVQWKAAKLLSTFVQRAGRAARNPNRTGIAIQFVEPSAYCINPTEEPPKTLIKPDLKRKRKNKPSGLLSTEQRANSESANETRKTPDQGFRSDIPAEPELRDDSPGEGIYCFIQTTLCRRRIWDAMFGNSGSNRPSVPCCDLCDPSFLDRFHFTPTQKLSRRPRIPKGEICPTIVDMLEAWRDSVFERDYPTASWESSVLLDDSLICILASIGPVKTLEQIKPVLATQWAHWNKYGSDIFDVMSATTAKLSTRQCLTTGAFTPYHKSKQVNPTILKHTQDLHSQ
ncbi:P-loop containing nucleoside triphosphate hydrolase protein [Ceratobasidium sp. AG-I]|nr:P-loop containing nucleoside triphosphate hydrolase protein [Ceratobasidium sp. AG-I]